MGGSTRARAAVHLETEAPRGRGPRFRSPGNLTPLLRLVGLIALAILIVVLLAVWVEGCATDRKRERYTDYVTEIGAVGNASARLGQELSTTLTTPGLKLEDLDAKLGGYVQTAENQVQRAEDLDAPDRCTTPTRERSRHCDSGSTACAACRRRSRRPPTRRMPLPPEPSSLRRGSGCSPATSCGRTRSVSVPRRLSSRRRCEGIEVPTSEFVADDEIMSPSDLAAIWQRIQGASTGGTPSGLHGSGISYVKALPSGQLLSETTEATILVTDELAFEVGVEDTGDSQEVQLKVTLTIPSQPDPIVQSKTIPIIDPGETKAVTFQIGSLVPFGEQVSVKVDVDPVQGETNTANNTAEYPVIFTLQL